MAKHDRLIEIAARVKSLREELKLAEAELERVLSGDDDAARTTAKPGSVAHRVLSVLQHEPMRDFGVDELATLLPGVPGSTLRSTVARLAREGVIDKRERGQYRAKGPERSPTGHVNGVTPETPEEPRPIPVRAATAGPVRRYVVT